MIIIARKYIHRHVGDVINNGAVLIERIDRRLWKIRCACGNIFIAQPAGCSGNCKECGNKQQAMSKIMHGESPDSKKNASHLYSVWLGMRQRCNNPKVDSYKYYGGRGIRVASEWDDYLVFKKWALQNGYNEHLSIDRINVNGNYEPDNCRWTTQKEQCRNKRDNHYITFNGETKTLVEWSEILGFKYHTLKNRINRYGFTIEEAFTLPISKGNNWNLRHHKAGDETS